MAHELSMVNGVFEMAYLLSDGIPWHGLGQAINDDEADDLAVWGQRSNMHNFDFELAPVLFYDETADDVSAFQKYSVALRSDTRQPVEVVGSNYKVLQPRVVLDSFDSLIRDLGYKMTSCGVLFGGKKFWAQAFTGETRNIGGMDRVNSSLLIATGFDQSTVVMDTRTRVVCNNTLRQATQSGNGIIRVPHSTHFDADAIKAQMGINTDMFKEWCDIAEAMASVKMSNDQALEFLGEVFEIYETETEATPEERILLAADNRACSACHDLFAGAGMGADLVTAKGTLWGAVNSVTEYIDHHRKTQTIDARVNGAWFGTQSNIKQRAWDTALLRAA